MKGVAEVDLRPVISEFIEQMRNRPVDIEKHMSQKYYHGFFKEAIVPLTKVYSANAFEDDFIFTQEILLDNETDES